MRATARAFDQARGSHARGLARARCPVHLAPRIDAPDLRALR